MVLQNLKFDVLFRLFLMQILFNMRNVLFLLLKIIVVVRGKDVYGSSAATNCTFKSSKTKNSIFLTAIPFCWFNTILREPELIYALATKFIQSISSKNVH